jgi:hypothetical protein
MVKNSCVVMLLVAFAVCFINKVLRGFDDLLESHIQAINWDDCNKGATSRV